MVAMIYFQVMMMLMLLNMMVMVKVLYYDDDHEEDDDNVDDEVMMMMKMVNVLDDPNEVERLHSTPVQVRKVLMMMMTMIMAGSRKYKSTRGGQEPKLSFFVSFIRCDFFISESDQVLSIFGNYLPNKKAHYNGWCKRRGVRFVFVL